MGNTILSDLNSYGKSSVISDKVYSDLSSEVVHPTSGRALLSKDLDAVKNSLKNLILTRVGERVFNPRFGSKLDLALFEHPTPSTAITIKSEIEKIIIGNEKRIKLIDVLVFETNFETNFDIVIKFIMGYAPPTEITFKLNRLR